jgi:hypothetical protein
MAPVLISLDITPKTPADQEKLARALQLLAAEEAGSGYRFEDAPIGGSIPKRFMSSIDIGIQICEHRCATAPSSCSLALMTRPHLVERDTRVSLRKTIVAHAQRLAAATVVERNTGSLNKCTPSSNIRATCAAVSKPKTAPVVMM